MNEKSAPFPTKSRPGAVVKLAALQFLATVAFSLTLYYCFDSREALSALFGGGTAAVANLFFAGRLFVTRDDLPADDILRRFYRSESLKILFTLAMFAILIIVIKVSILPFIIAYLIAAVIVNMLFLLVPDNHSG